MASGDDSCSRAEPLIPHPSLLARILIVCVRGYKLVLSPVLPRACRFAPTCSEYALDAFRIHGAWRGGWLALRRISRCHPFHAGGIDPVPTSRLTSTSSEKETSSHG